MTGTAEKITILKGISIFAEIPDKILAEVAALVEEVEVGAGETIFEKGERGFCMYILVSGRMKVHDGERLLNYLGPRDVFGEMAVLVPEPRLASVTALENTRLLRLYQRPLYRLMEEQSKVAQGIIQVLCQRLRARVQDLTEDLGYRQEIEHLAEVAGEVEQGVYVPAHLEPLAARTDDLGQLALSFQRIIGELQRREAHLLEEIEALRAELAALKNARIGC